MGNNVRYFRKKFHLTQEQLAEKSGLSVNFISRLERTSDQNVSIKTLIKIAEAFEISLATLVSVSESTSEPTYLNPNVSELANRLEKLDNTKANEYSQTFLRILEISTEE
ncbi:helix-turn-helix domain-containing protein [Ligilactobacillus apodemi]|uniref:helix-turn-helix domain-containing protein n=1 Tax=Ligilactobacillus apodemi TaxID=307126 RepID=UPI00214C571B|nr:helix-turn-helix transcriptional regulator [Ligilactobacillus apodemi]MCR1901235.1 helix-turn-helix domain-containing protein [Ligilactobacillus apodemi]